MVCVVVMCVFVCSAAPPDDTSSSLLTSSFSVSLQAKCKNDGEEERKRKMDE